MVEPTPKELTLIKEFRSIVSDFQLTEDERSDMSLVAWLRARDLDLKKSTEMLKTSIEWRKQNDIANIKTWNPPASYDNDYQYAYVGEDKDGNPVLILPFGTWDVRHVMDCGEKETWMKYTDKLFAMLLEHVQNAAKTQGKIITQFVVVVDFKGFTMRQLTCLQGVDSLLEVVRRFEGNYPETLKAGYVVNAPFIFNLLFNLIKPLLSKRTLGKVEVHGSNDKKWKATLLKTIPPDVLPTAYGGTSQFTFKLPSDTNGVDKQDSTEIDSEFLCTHIEPGNKFELQFDITQPNTTFKWIFKTESYDVGFSIRFNDSKEVVPYKRCNSHLEPQRGTFLCETPGKYLLIFDNSYSRMKTKTLRYIVTNTPVVDVIED